MIPAFQLSRTRALVLSLLASLALLGGACNPVDIDEALAGLSKRCVNQGSCAPGFVCEEQRCVVKVGEACREGFENALCEKTQGVCAGMRHACTDGVVEASCSAASYGPQYQAQESLCDGLDNDCDGSVDIGLHELALGGVNLSPGSSLQVRLAPFGDGLLAVSINGVNLGTPQQPRVHSVLRLQPLSRSREPLPGVDAQVLHEVTGPMSDLRLLPFQGGLFVQWQVQREMQTQTGYTYTLPVTHIARVDVGTGRPTVGIAPREMPNPYGTYVVRAAVSGNSQRLLITWAVGTVRGQLFSLELEPLSENVQLSGPHPSDPANAGAQRADVAAYGPTDFALAWIIPGPYNESTGAPSGPNQLRFRRLSADLLQLGEVLGLEGETGYTQDLSLLGASREGVEPLAAWNISAPFVSGQPPRATLRYALPFAPGLPRSEPVPVSQGSSSVELGRDADEQALMLFLRPSPTGVGTPILRRVGPGLAAAERVLGVVPTYPFGPVSFLPGAGPESWALSLMVSAPPRMVPSAATVCRF